MGRAGRPAWEGLWKRRRKQARGGSRGGQSGGMRAEPKGERYGAPPRDKVYLVFYLKVKIRKVFTFR